MPRMKALLNKKSFRYMFYFSLIAIMFAFLFGIGQFFNINQFLESVELKTLDFRYGTSSKVIKHNPNVVVLTIDDNSIELLEDEFGGWPWNRSAYTTIINYLESGGVDSVIFDLMFIGYQKDNKHLDLELAKTINKNKNVYVAMNFDDRGKENPPKLPDRLKIKVDNQSKNINFNNFTFENCRLVMDEIINSSSNIGITNFLRDRDGVSRHAPLFIKYKNDFYPYLGFKAAYEYLGRKENLNTDKFTINKNNELLLGKRKIELDKDGLMLINWYGPENTFQYVPFWQVIKSMHDAKAGETPTYPKEFFKDKIVFIGVTATSMFDIKNTPLSRVYPGVEIQATVFNNLIDGNSIQKANIAVNIAICVLLSIITGLLVIKIRSVIASSLIVIIFGILYIFLAAILFSRFFIWIGIFNQIIVITLTFTFMYIIKYLMKSRDFEYTYKLATTDGLTGLYNHRYFQESVENAIKKARKHNSHFSLIFVDIDFFKKFNDTYGHQAGDIVLKRVAQILKTTVKSSDIVARYGGEEMAAIIHSADTDTALHIANRLCKTVADRKYKLAENVEVGVTISLGVSTFPQHGETPADLIEFADQGLYRAKRDGRNQVGRIEEPPKLDTENPVPAN